MMNFNAKDSPEKFKRIYLLLAFSCLVLILVVSLVVINRNSKSDLAHATEVNAAKIAAALVSSERETLRIEAEGSEATVAIAPDSIPALDRRIRAFLKPFDIVKIKVYSKDMKIIYCTEQALIGKLDSGNKRLKTALEGTVQTVMKDRQSITDLAVEKRYEVDLAEVYVPVRGSSGQVAGVFELYTDITLQKRGVKDHLVSSILYLIGAILSISLVSYVVIVKESEALRAAYQLLETTAITDSLTGIFNRGHLLLRAEELYELMKRSRDKVTPGVGLGVVMIDIDHFKKVNDTYGHLAGDSVLSSLAARIEAVLRPYDTFGRYGGEEFMVFLPNTTLEETEQIARRVIDVVNSTPFACGAQSLVITVSVGGTWTDAGVESFDTVLCRADELLYEAKRSGRNQAVFKLETAAATGEV
jgi:diguanylate cyclase (GGDEF)-like protein